MLSVTVTNHGPAARPVVEGLGSLLLQTYEYGPTPPEAEAVALPVVPPLQSTSVCVVESTSWGGPGMVTRIESVQPFWSVTISVYVPAVSRDVVVVVSPFDQE